MSEIITGLVIGTIVTIIGGFILRYLWNLYMVPHPHLRVLWGSNYLTIENIGDASIDWAIITARTTDSRSLIVGFAKKGNIELTTPQEGFISGNFLRMIATDLKPGDWGHVTLNIDGPEQIEVEVKSSCKYEIGGKQTVGSAPTHGEWGEEETYGEWLETHKQEGK